MHIIKARLSLRDNGLALEAMNRGETHTAAKLLDRAIMRTGYRPIVPAMTKTWHMAQLQKHSEAIELFSSVTKDLMPRTTMDESTKNYIVYYMLSNMPPEYQREFAAFRVYDPIADIEKVNRVIRRRYPYNPPSDDMKVAFGNR